MRLHRGTYLHSRKRSSTCQKRFVDCYFRSVLLLLSYAVLQRGHCRPSWQENRVHTGRAHQQSEDVRLPGGAHHPAARLAQDYCVESQHAAAAQDIRSVRCCSQRQRVGYKKFLIRFLCVAFMTRDFTFIHCRGWSSQ